MYFRKTSFLLLVMASMAVIAVSCTSSEDYNKSGETNSIDSTVMSKDHTQAPMTTTADTPLVTATPAPGTAKPNPLKKGAKGKVAVVLSKNTSSTSKEMDKDGYYYNVDIMPSFTGGQQSMERYFTDNIQYPQDAIDNGVEGTVNVMFDVDENGKLHSPRIVGERVGYGIDEEALRLVNRMPVWTAGKVKGKNVKTHVTLPVRFILE